MPSNSYPLSPIPYPLIMIRHSRSGTLLPWYTRCWNWWKQFPAILATGASTPPETAGIAAAALMSAAIGAVMMMVAHHLSHTSVDREQSIEWLGSWIPGANNIDPATGNIGTFAGVETVLLVGWLVSWVILHGLLQHRQVSTRTIFFGTFGLLIAAIVMCWHPLFPYLPLQ
jgi:hypothetical protein